jgi:hypothetical protein
MGESRSSQDVSTATTVKPLVRDIHAGVIPKPWYRVARVNSGPTGAK